ncbi:MAG: hypothetical protein AzoDbin1_04215 [Azoarcus sp.]|nr:hypothetical protein [Azoarcus sp.]
MDNKQFSHSFTKNGAELTAEISPCCWMYPGYGLQVTVQMKDGGNVIKHRKDVIWEQATESQVIEFTESIGVCSCSRCGKPAFDPATCDTNRAGLCEHCFLSDLDAQHKKSKAKEEQKLKRRDAAKKRQGFTHRVTAWVHPEAGGDDYMVDLYCKGKPSAAQIKAELKKSGSRVLDDYQILEL